MTGLSEELTELLEAERDIDAPSPTQREHLLARLQPLLVVPAALAVGAAASSTAAQATGGVLKAKLGAVALSAALIGGAVGATGHAYFAGPPRVAPSAPSIAPVLAPVAASHAAVEPVPEAAASSVASAEVKAPEPSAPRTPRPAPGGSLRAERLLIEAASAALMRGDAESALTALRQHAERFPGGALAEEREALLARARAASRKP